ncbi:BirA family biotin operon repressor/biotin-[acetyl-CoA-carboxylase] ligase [Povalibacter uvarum]|uniref:Bifunctional ligase/repressor BirA n=1 Tax=Povalibacter uvarum TaxID=732238 RepID=A0A841HRX3_9GAMM|nr:bifunctional biotin--[acetyl-CoA-carboxylase] ligase/biotin operon repressor BirA [Povalibacter uvarum]MBB6095646.1 BirA family biotin operon repressor/biotin-[acetyl-CoA-carboxylase] ligase [Povalibacter uvarum]
MVQRRSQTQARRLRLLSLLSDGAFHSGEKLAKRLRVSRAGIWKLIHSLQDLGIEIESVARQGYRLPRAVDLLDKSALLAAMSKNTQALLDHVDVMLTVDSTNRYVYDNVSVAPGHAQLCVAEVQNAGRGRRGRTWLAPFGSGICMSIGWQFQEAPPTFSALSLAVGVAAIRALKRFGADDVALKWPNDLIWRGRKLGGILIEMRGESGGPSTVVIGIGVNMHMPTAARLALAEQQAALIADVHEILRDRTPTRNAVAGALTEEIVAMLRVFALSGFAAFADEWRQLDGLADAPVKVMAGTQTLLGTARGVDTDGALLVEMEGELRRFVSGEVSVRSERRA